MDRKMLSRSVAIMALAACLAGSGVAAQSEAPATATSFSGTWTNWGFCAERVADGDITDGLTDGGPTATHRGIQDASSWTATDDRLTERLRPPETDPAPDLAAVLARAEADGLVDVAYATTDSPVGPLLVAATPAAPAAPEPPPPLVASQIPSGRRTSVPPRTAHADTWRGWSCRSIRVAATV